MIPVLGAFVEKISSMQGQTGNVRAEMEVLRKNQGRNAGDEPQR